MKRRRTGLLLAGIALLGAAAVWFFRSKPATPVVSGRHPVAVRLANRTVTAEGFPSAAHSAGHTPSARGTLPYVLVATGRVDKAVRLAAEATGARVIGPYPPNALLIEADADALHRLAADPRFAAATEFLPDDKLDPRLTKILKGGPESVEVTMVALAPEDRSSLVDLVVAQGGEVLKGCLNGKTGLKARLPADEVGTFARRGEVRWLEPFSRPKLLNDFAVEPEAMNVREVWNLHGLSGTNQVVSTSDSGIDTGDLATMHRDLADRICGFEVVDGCYETDVVGHGTHTAGSIVGNGTMSDGEIRGVAWGAKLWAWFCTGTDGYLYVPGDCDTLFRPAQDEWPAFIHSASWGGEADGWYDSDCAEIDAFVWEHPDFLPVFSCGNFGPSAYTVGSPAAAKNVLTVGATQNLRVWSSGSIRSGTPSLTASYSSRGPCQDGRVKPDLAAPGTGILSTRAYDCSYRFGVYTNENYAYDCGTSMATPLVAGAAALVREWLVDRRGFTNETPSAALIKAVLTGGAKGATDPDNLQGWGRVDLEETLFPSGRAVKLIDRIPFAPGTNFLFAVETTNAAPLDVQLVWVDRPAESGVDPYAPTLVNDLDLSVTYQANDVRVCRWGNGLSGPDRLNTVESVRLEEAPAGTYLIAVDCSRIVYDHAEGGAAALYIRGAFDPDAGAEPDLVMVSVAVEAGAAEAGVFPPVGVTKVEKGTTVVFSAPEWAYRYGAQGTPSARQAFRGSVGTGDAPASGNEREFRVTVSNDTSVVWRYDEDVSDYLFTLCAFLDGVPPSGYSPYVYEAWLTNGTVISLSFPEDAALGEAFPYTGLYPAPGPYRPKQGTYVFRLGAVAYAQTDADDWMYLVSEDNGEMWRSVDITMDEGVDLWSCYFNETERTPGGLPYWWYMRYLWGGEMMFGYDSSATGDPDGDGFPNAAEYAGGTDPVDDSSFRLRIDGFSPTNLVFTGSLKGRLIVESAPSLTSSWQGVSTNDPPRTSTTNNLPLPPSSATSLFYRVIYQR